MKKKTEQARQRKLEIMFKKTTSTTGSGSRPKKSDKKFDLKTVKSILCAAAADIFKNPSRKKITAQATKPSTIGRKKNRHRRRQKVDDA